MPLFHSVSTEPPASTAAETIELETLQIAEAPVSIRPTERAVEDLTERVTQQEMHRRLVQALGSSSVRSHSPWHAKPFEMDLAPPLPQRVRVYMYNATCREASQPRRGASTPHGAHS